ncbi:MAG: hypothetical protein ABSE70_07630 [Candidatus Limnocylindrales bacterium]
MGAGSLSFGETVFVVLISALVGYLVSLWQTRSRPYVVLSSFMDTPAPGDAVEVPPALCDATYKSLMVPTLLPLSPVADLTESYLSAKKWLQEVDSTGLDLHASVNGLADKSPQEVRDTIRTIIRARPFGSLLESGLDTGQIVTAEFGKKPVVIPFKFDPEERQGSFCFDLGRTVLWFGSGLSQRVFSRPRMEPFVQLFVRLECDKLADVMDQFVRLVDAETIHCREIVARAEPIANQSSRWMAVSTITNLGQTPFVLSPDRATMSIRSRHLRGFGLSAHLQVEGECDEWVEPDGVVLVRQGQTRAVAVVTDKVQREITAGAELRAAYDDESCEAAGRIQIRLVRGGLPWQSQVRSEWVNFTNTGLR